MPAAKGEEQAWTPLGRRTRGRPCRAPSGASCGWSRYRPAPGRLQLLGHEQGRWPSDHASRRVRSHCVGSHELLHERQQLESGETGLQLHEELRGRGAGESLAKRENLACRRLPHGVRHQGASSRARGTLRNLHVQRRLGRARQGRFPQGGRPRGVGGAIEGDCVGVDGLLPDAAEPAKGFERAGM